MTDERLNYLADRFVQLELEALLRISCWQYLLDPEGYEKTAAFLRNGGALCTYYRPAWPVKTTPSNF